MSEKIDPHMQTLKRIMYRLQEIVCLLKGLTAEDEKRVKEVEVVKSETGAPKIVEK